MSAPLEFIDPPRRGNLDQYDWDDVAHLLFDNPDEWARLDLFDTANPAATLASNIRRGRTPLDPDEHEVRSAKVTHPGEPDQWGTWVRYVGPTTLPEVQGDDS